MESRDIRKQGAQTRQEAYDKLTPKQKLEQLDKKYGIGIGAKKVRAKLAVLISQPPVKVTLKKSV